MQYFILNTQYHNSQDMAIFGMINYISRASSIGTKMYAND